MEVRSAICRITSGRNLSAAAMKSAMHEIAAGEATPAQIAAFLIGLRMKGETTEEIAAAASVLREHVTRVHPKGTPLVDTCGTGGDGVSTFNISTASAFVAAGAGAYVAKHGNRSVSSRSGSADVLERAGVDISLPASRVEHCIDHIGIGFLFSPQHHGVVQYVSSARREIGVRTLFNVLGPLANPASAPNQVIGVFDAFWVAPIAEVAARLGTRHVMVVHSADGLDEISIGAPTVVAEYREGTEDRYEITPEQFGFRRSDLDAVYAAGPDESLSLIRSALAGADSPARNIVALNAGAAIYVAGLAADLKCGVEAAMDVLSEGKGLEKLNQLSRYSRNIASSLS